MGAQRSSQQKELLAFKLGKNTQNAKVKIRSGNIVMRSFFLKSAAVVLFASIGTAAQALPKIGEPLPTFMIDDKGQMQLRGDEIGYQPFNSASINGKTTALLLIAARESASKLNEPFQTALSAKKPASSNHQVITILGLDQAVWGTKGIALGRLKDKQKAFPTSNFVVDATGSARTTLGLEPKSYAVIIVGANGRVIRAKDGAMTPAEINDFIAAYRNDN